MRPTEVKGNRNRNLGMRTKFKHCKWKETRGMVASAYVFFSFDMKIGQAHCAWLGRFERAKLSLNEILLSDAVAMSFFVLMLEGGIDGLDESERKPPWYDALSTPEQGAVNNPKYHAWAFVIYYYDQRGKASHGMHMRQMKLSHSGYLHRQESWQRSQHESLLSGEVAVFGVGQA